MQPTNNTLEHANLVRVKLPPDKPSGKPICGLARHNVVSQLPAAKSGLPVAGKFRAGLPGKCGKKTAFPAWHASRYSAPEDLKHDAAISNNK